MIKKVEHLYIHIPFCKSICSYCDFIRKVANSKIEIDEYLKKIVKQIKKECTGLHFKTIYIGGGTPNCLNDKQLEFLLKNITPYLSKKYEFTIELNPELVTELQGRILYKNKINRVSLGVQSCNDKILKDFKRTHNTKDVQNALKILKTCHINNISVDFIYGYKLMKKQDILNDIKFIKKNKIKHVSFYSLELKEKSILNKSGYIEDDFLIESQLKLIISELKKARYKRYEVSNWCLTDKYQSQHNLAYWQYKDWKGIGIGAYGNEAMQYYHYDFKFKKHVEKLPLKSYYQNILIMGLRLGDGLDLKKSDNFNAYNFFKKKLDPKKILIINNHLKVKNLNLLDDVLLSII